jgi:cytochrome P450
MIAQRRRAHRTAAVVTPSDLLDRLLLSVDDITGEAMSDVQLRDELMTLLVAGQETSAILLTWACSLLAQHPDAQAAVAAEATAVLGATRAPGAGDYGALQHASAVVLETMRLLPPAYLVGRCADVDVRLGPYSLPKGTTVLVSPYVMHRAASTWGADALTFRPQRWFDGGSDDGGAPRVDVNAALKGMGARDAYVPFGAGPRNCIGMGFALMEAVLVLAALCRDVTFSLPPGEQPPKPAALITLRPAAARLAVHRRA